MAMPEQPTGGHLENTLADLKVRRTKLDAAIAAIEELLGVAPSAAANVATPSESMVNGQISSDAFFGMSIPDAVKKYLRMVRRKQPTLVIARALEGGGFQHSSKYFPNTVRTALGRMDEVVQVGKEWGLAEWYPGLRKSTKAAKDEGEPQGGDD